MQLTSCECENRSGKLPTLKDRVRTSAGEVDQVFWGNTDGTHQTLFRHRLAVSRWKRFKLTMSLTHICKNSPSFARRTNIIVCK